MMGKTFHDQPDAPRDNFLCNEPKWWRKQTKHRPQRQAVRKLRHTTLEGADPDELNWPLDRKPHWYYW